MTIFWLTTQYNWNRYYNPVTGRYVTSDPIGLNGGINVYGYATQNPAVLTDVRGLWVDDCARTLGSNPKPTNLNSPLRHEYLNIRGKIYSFTQTTGKVLWTDGEISHKEDTSKANCRRICDDDRIDVYIEQAAVRIGLTKYCIFGDVPFTGANNCQTWAGKVYRSGLKKYRKSVQCPKC